MPHSQHYANVADPAQQFDDVATRLGWQEDGTGGGFWLYNLRVALGKHPVGSTLSEESIWKLLAAN